MFSTRLVQLLLVALSVLSIAQGFMVDENIVDKADKRVVRRQGSGPSSSDTVQQTSTSQQQSSSSTSPPPTSTTSTPPSSTPTIPSSSTPPPTSSTPTSSIPTTSSTSSSSSSSDETPITSMVTESQSTITTVVVTTASDGKISSFTTQSTSTPVATLAPGSKQNSGMSTETRNTIIGTVVGIGGAIILGALAFVAWRIWGRKKQVEDTDDFGYGGSYTGTEHKSEAGTSATTGTGRSPFQSTLESYHAPTQVNTASNF